MNLRICICDGVMHPSWLIDGNRCLACGQGIEWLVGSTGKGLIPAKHLRFVEGDLPSTGAAR